MLGRLVLVVVVGAIAYRQRNKLKAALIRAGKHLYAEPFAKRPSRTVTANPRTHRRKNAPPG
jgi:hypothetical protein